MIKRKAIIIGSPGGYRNLKFLKGVLIDVENYFAFLTSKAGGQWYENEIEILLDPDSNTLIEAISKAKSDYFFITFSGHGLINSFTKSDYICLRDKDLSISNLVSKSEKQTIIVDACREIDTNLSDNLNYSLITESKLYTESISTREIFDEAISKTPSGIILVYSTQPNQSAGDDEFKGGHFTFSFLKAGIDWWKSDKNQGILKLDIAVDNAEKIMKTTFLTNQKPEMGGQIRRLTFPPFAISK